MPANKTQQAAKKRSTAGLSAAQRSYSLLCSRGSGYDIQQQRSHSSLLKAQELQSQPELKPEVVLGSSFTTVGRAWPLKGCKVAKEKLGADRGHSCAPCGLYQVLRQKAPSEELSSQIGLRLCSPPLYPDHTPHPWHTRRRHSRPTRLLNSELRRELPSCSLYHCLGR